MTLLELVSQRNAENKALKQQVDQLRRSRDAWKVKHKGCMWENQQLRRAIKRLKEQRDKWKWTHRRAYQRPPEWKNIHLSAADLERIMGMKPR
jgi:chromosome segregation ATPase